MRTYPIMLDVRGRLCVVVGAGRVGLRKAEGLLAAGAKVRLVAPHPPPGPLPAEVEVRPRSYEPGDLDGSLLVFACTNDAGLNARVAADARRRGALVNVVDDPPHCDFYAPAVFAEGDVVLAVGTGGSAPTLAAALRDRAAAAMPAGVGPFAAALEQARKIVLAASADGRRRHALMKRLAGEEGLAAFAQGGPAEVLALAQRLVNDNANAGHRGTESTENRGDPPEV